jgi:hypothetical protein
MEFVKNSRVLTLFVMSLIISVSVVIPATTVFAASSGPNSGTTFSGNVARTGGDHNWSNANNATSSNNVYASVQITDSSNISNYLRATGFGFNIPAGATINGIAVGIERSEANSQQATIRDSAVHLVKNNTVVGDNKAATTINWPTSDATATYGGTADLWGATWTRDDINNANFGVVVSVGRTTGGDEIARVDAITITVTYTVTISNQTITVTTNAPASAIYDNSFNVAATASSGLTVAITTEGGCSISGTTVTMTSGTTDCVVKYNQAGNASFNAAPQITQTVDAQKANANISISGYNGTYDGASHGASGTASGVNGEDLSAQLNLGASFTDVPGGTANWTFTGDANYNDAAGTAAITIAKQDITATVTAADKTYDGTTSAVATTNYVVLPSDDVVVEYSSATFADANVGTDTLVTVTGMHLTGTDIGNYNLLNTEATTNADILPVAVTVTADAQSKVFGAADPALTYTYSGTLVGSDAFTGTLARAAGENVGTYAISQGTLALTSNYVITFNGADLTITKADGAISLSGLSHTYDGTEKSASVTSEYTYDVTYDGAGILPVDAGSYAVVASITDANHVGSTNATLVIAKAPLTVTAVDQSIKFGEEPAAFTANIEGFVTGEDETVFTAAVTCNVDGAHTAIGTYNIVCSGGAADNYSFTYVNGTLTISTDPDNASPVAEGGVHTTNQNTTLDLTLAASDENDAPLTWSIVDEPDHGSLTGSGGARTYTPATDYFGADAFSFKVNDGNSDSSVATVNIFVHLLASCPDGFNKVEGQCEATGPITACEEGYAYNGSNCIPESYDATCAEGTLNTTSGECDFPPTVISDPLCPEDFFYVNGGTCMKVNGTVGDTDPVETAPAFCGTDEEVIRTVGDVDKCVIPTPSVDACPSGFEYAGGECVPDGSDSAEPSCPIPGVLLEGGLCLPNPVELQCPAGYAREGIICLPVTMFDLVVTSSGPGSVSCNPGSCDTTHAEDTAVVIAATPAANASVQSWSHEGCTGTSCEITINADTTVSVTFACNSGFHLDGDACVADSSGSSNENSNSGNNNSNSNSNSGSGGGGGGGGGSYIPPVPQVLGAATTGACYQFTRNLSYGMNGADVLELQKALTAKGFMTVTPNGNFGPATQAAVIAFQKANGLEQVGMMGPKTRALLNVCPGGTNPNQALIDELTKKLNAILVQIQQLLAARGQQ